MAISTSTGRDTAQRRTDLDWARIAAFALLILYHIGMYYVPEDWVVKSPHIVPWLQIPMDWSSPWRLLLLFIVSGAATRFMAGKFPPGALFASRSLRLLPPLIFATLVVIPPEFYVQAIERYGYGGGYPSFWADWLRGRSDLCGTDGCVFVPNWDYLWFVAYLWIYTALLLGGFALAPHLRAWLDARGRWLLAGPRLFLVPAGVLIAARLVLRHFWPETHNLIDDWYLHTVYFLCFLFGYLFATSDAVWDGFKGRRHLALGVAVVSYALYALYAWRYAGDGHPPMTARLLMVTDYGVDQWAWVAAALGYARRYLTDRDGPARRYLTEAIFPYYIVHQTAIVVVAHLLLPLRLSLAAEAAILVVATVASCAGTYEIARRVAWLRPWFGLKRSPVQAKPMRPPAATSAPIWPPYQHSLQPAAVRRPGRTMR